MKLWSWILLALSVLATTVLAVNWRNNARHLRTAQADTQAFAEKAAHAQLLENMDRQHDRMQTRNDELRLSNAQLDQEYALRRGDIRGYNKATGEEQQAQAMLSADHLLEDSTQNMDAVGGPQEIRGNLQRSQAAADAATVYAGLVTRDQHLAYAAGALWICTGFAFALRKR